VKFSFVPEKALTMKQANLGGQVQKRPSSDCTSTAVVSPDPVSYSINFFNYEHSRKHR
jgi:hypothetical protein